MKGTAKWIIALVLVGALGSAVGYRVGRSSRPPGEANLVEEVGIETNGITAEVAVYGDFDVVVRLKNPGKEDLRDLKVVAEQLHAVPGYPEALPGSERMVQYVAVLPAGQEVPLRFKGLKAFHPEEKQEVVISVLGHRGLGKAGYRAVFPPGSED